MTIEATKAIVTNCETLRFSCIVKQRCPTQHRLGADTVHNCNRMLPDISIVVGIVLLEAKHMEWNQASTYAEMVKSPVFLTGEIIQIGAIRVAHSAVNPLY